MSRPCNQLGQTTKTIANWDALAGRNAYIDNSDYVQSARPRRTPH